MILSDREIHAAIDRKSISIHPIPGVSAWSSTAVDLTLAAELITWNPPSVGGVPSAVAPAEKGYRFDKLLNESSQAHDCKNGFILKSGEFALGWTVEKISLPHRSRLAARVEGKSSLARLGVGVHVTAPTIHAGFGYKPSDPTFLGNPIQLEIWNGGPLDVQLNEGMLICQLIFEWVDGTPEKGYEGRFSTQGPSTEGQVGK